MQRCATPDLKVGLTSVCFQRCQHVHTIHLLFGALLLLRCTVNFAIITGDAPLWNMKHSSLAEEARLRGPSTFRKPSCLPLRALPREFPDVLSVHHGPDALLCLRTMFYRPLSLEPAARGRSCPLGRLGSFANARSALFATNWLQELLLKCLVLGPS